VVGVGCVLGLVQATATKATNRDATLKLAKLRTETSKTVTRLGRIQYD
jgi:hypothetical protein